VVITSSAPFGYLSQFGSSGAGNGQFGSVQDVAVDPTTGDVYVTDGENRVQKFDSSGTYLSQFGSSGTGNGQFNRAEWVAVDPATSDVYVVDSGHNRVEKFGQ
jgi:DNA-binding beta-propeller fold protein YncE